MGNFSKFVIAASALMAMTVADASAISLTLRPSFNMGDRAARSSDGPNYDIPGYFLPYTDGNVYSVGSFAGDNTSWQFQLAGETTAYQDISMSAVNGSPSVTLFSGSDNVGALTTVAFTSSNVYTGFSISDPSGTFYSNDSLNPFGGQNLLAFLVSTAATITIPKANISNQSITLSLGVGDIVFAFEDLAMNFNSTTGVCTASDCDWNDHVILAKQVSGGTFNNVPEPASLLLLGTGLLGAYRSKRRVLN